MFRSVALFGQNNLLTIFVGINLALIGIGSWIYTQHIVDNIDEREVRQLRLQAKILQYATMVGNDQETTFLLDQINENIMQSHIPVIYVDEKGNPQWSRNIDLPESASPKVRQQILQQKYAEIKAEHPPIEIDLGGLKQYIYFSDSSLLVQMKFFPYVQIASILVLGFLAYLVFSAARTAEQNRVWVGLAKETAHQLGTPLSSLMGWVDYMRGEAGISATITDEIEKDVQRLEMITSRFSSIGSVPILKPENVGELVEQFLTYLTRRISTKVKLTVDNQLPKRMMTNLNRNLFEWVVENLCKNAVDSMGGVGALNVRLFTLPKDEIAIDISDTGKGISRANQRKIFKPGYSTKKRGWGLGLTLAKRIVEEYHGGKLFIKETQADKGTTFRIILKTQGVV